MADWVAISSLATAGGTLALAGATFTDPTRRRGLDGVRFPPLEHRPARSPVAA